MNLAPDSPVIFANGEFIDVRPIPFDAYVAASQRAGQFFRQYPNRWIIGDFARTTDGEDCSFMDDGPSVCYCAFGRVSHELCVMGFDVWERSAPPDFEPLIYALETFNDTRGVTVQMIADYLSACIWLAPAKAARASAPSLRAP